MYVCILFFCVLSSISAFFLLSFVRSFASFVSSLHRLAIFMLIIVVVFLRSRCANNRYAAKQPIRERLWQGKENNKIGETG